MEVNFVTMKFMELPNIERRRLYGAFKSTDKETKVSAAFEILKLLTHAPQGELTEYANSTFGLNLADYFVWNDQENLISRAFWLDNHFAENLKLDGDRVFLEPIPVKSTSSN